MAIKNILVAYSGTESSKSAVKLAVLMALKYDVHLTDALTFAPSEVGAGLKPYASSGLTKVIAKAEAQSRATIRDAGLLIMGAYEHIKFLKTFGAALPTPRSQRRKFRC